MPTDAERREVARRLRELRMTAPGVTSVGHGYLWSLLWAVSGDELEGSSRRDWFERMCSRLAGLIEPSSDREALLALADEMETADPEDLDVAIDYVTECASRIRQAIGG